MWSAVIIMILECLVYLFFAYSKEFKLNLRCSMIALGAMLGLQLIFLICFLGGQDATSNDYNKIMISSQVLNAINGCSDHYLTIDPREIVKDITFASSNLGGAQATVLIYVPFLLI
jgi:hypothetical protein